MTKLKDVLLDHGNYNVIIVDWTGGNGLPYTQAAVNTRVTGAEVGLLVKKLQVIIISIFLSLFELHRDKHISICIYIYIYQASKERINSANGFYRRILAYRHHRFIFTATVLALRLLVMLESG